MRAKSLNSAVGADQRRRLFIYTGGFLKDRRIRHILSLAGYDLKLGLPREGDAVGIWGHSPTAHRGEAIAEKHSAPIIRIEDSFLRSVLPGRSGSPPLGLTIDSKGMHYDPAQISDLEEILTHDPLDNTNLMNRARTCIARLHEAHLTKYTGFDPTTPCPDPGYVLVLDQTLNDASVVKSGADRSTFLEMLVFAQEEHPGKRVLIKTHPDTLAGHREGYFKPTDVNQNVRFFAESVSPWTLLEGAAAVYTVSSQLGFEAIFAGHKPRVFGQPFYIGWGLTQDERPVQRRQRQLSRAQLFAGAMILYPKWYDPYRDCLCDLETAIDTLEAQSRAWREDHTGWVASGILVPGQVEDDASILSGTKTISTNLELLRAARNAHPDAILLYKPHPDVEAGLRVGKIEQAELDTLCDVVLNNVDPITAINAVDEVWTMTSLLGFEALVRGKSVTCHGAPFYAGWGLTTDLGAVPARRSTQVSLEALVHATLIDYPRYFDPITKAACPPEVVIERLASGKLPNASPFNRALSKLQGFFAGHAHLWRR